MSKPSSTTAKTVKTDPRVVVLASEYARIHALRSDAEVPAVKASMTRALQRLWDAIAKIDSSALADLAPIRSAKSAALISDDASAILAALADE